MFPRACDYHWQALQRGQQLDFALFAGMHMHGRGKAQIHPHGTTFALDYRLPRRC